MMNDVPALWALCDYIVGWTQHLYEESAGKMSPEVYDRCVSVIGIAVPLLLLAAALAAFVCILGTMWRGARK